MSRPIVPRILVHFHILEFMHLCISRDARCAPTRASRASSSARAAATSSARACPAVRILSAFPVQGDIHTRSCKLHGSLQSGVLILMRYAEYKPRASHHGAKTPGGEGADHGHATLARRDTRHSAHPWRWHATASPATWRSSSDQGRRVQLRLWQATHCSSD